MRMVLLAPAVIALAAPARPRPQRLVDDGSAPGPTPASIHGRQVARALSDDAVVSV